MTTLLTIAVLVLTVSSAQAAEVAEERSPARRLGAIAPASCPYQFGDDMPSATFCVYRGVALGSGGEVCATDVVVIWSSFGSRARATDVEPAPNASSLSGEVYLGFVADPEVVLRASVGSRQSHRAEIVGYTVGRTEAPRALAGEMTLRTVRPGSSGAADVLSMELREPRAFRPGGCALGSYSGTFVGVIGPPIETGAYQP
jgi:hypothetical protein